MNWTQRSIVTAAAIMATIPAVAQSPVRSERVQFPRGTASTTVRGTVRGYDVIDYVVGARAGQAMTVSLQTTNKSAYFNVLPPRSEEALFNGSIAGNRYNGRLKDSGDYRVRVYLMRSAARRGERAAFGVTIAVNSRQAGDNGGGGGGISPGAIGSGAPITQGNMPAFCRGEASRQYGVRPNYIATARVVSGRSGTTIDGSADQGRDGVKRFRCRFDARGRFIDVMALTRDGF